MEENKTKTSWTKATTNVTEALVNVTTCLKYGHNAWLEIQRNGEQEYPILTPNPLLENPFNWKSAYGSIRPKLDEIDTSRCINETEKDLILNWEQFFGNQEAIDLYQKKSEITKDLCFGMGVAHLMPIEDANKWSEQFRKDKFKYGYWMIHPTPKDEIKKWIPADIDKVIVVCYNDEPVNLKESFNRVGQFCIDYSKTL